MIAFLLMLTLLVSLIVLAIMGAPTWITVVVGIYAVLSLPSMARVVYLSIKSRQMPSIVGGLRFHRNGSR